MPRRAWGVWPLHGASPVRRSSGCPASRCIMVRLTTEAERRQRDMAQRSPYSGMIAFDVRPTGEELAEASKGEPVDREGRLVAPSILQERALATVPHMRAHRHKFDILVDPCNHQVWAAYYPREREPKVVDINPQDVKDGTPTTSLRFPDAAEITAVHVASRPEYEQAEQGDVLRLIGKGLQCEVLSKKMDNSLIYFETIDLREIRYQ